MPPPSRRQRKAPRLGKVTTSKAAEGGEVMLDDEKTVALLGVGLGGEEMEK